MIKLSTLFAQGVLKGNPATPKRKEKTHRLPFSIIHNAKRLAVLFALIIASSVATHALGLGGFINLTPSTNFCDGFFITGLTFTLAGENLPFVFMAETSGDVIDHNFTINAAFDFPLHTFRAKLPSNSQVAKTLPTPNKNPLNSLFKWNLALGALVGSTIERDNAKLNMAPRFSATFSWERLDGFLEPFLTVALQPTYTLDFLNQDNTFRLLIPIGAGVRIWD